MEQPIQDIAAMVVHHGKVLELLRALVTEGVDITVIHNYVGVIALEKFHDKRLDLKYPYDPSI